MLFLGVKMMTSVKNKITLAGLICALSIQPSGPQAISTLPIVSASRSGYVGDEACRDCHFQKLESYSQTAHKLTSGLPTKDSVLGSFAVGKNILKTSNPALYFRMESRPAGFFQTSVTTLSSVPSMQSEKMDIVIGSGRTGQTYLFWKDDRLFELPVSYWSGLRGWVSSPGYGDDIADFDRPVTPRCLECHTDFAGTIPGPDPPNHYYPPSLIMGISCERCHGPGRKHLDATKVTTSDARIINPVKLPRDRQIELCAQCHDSSRRPVAAAFSYLPGERLDNFLQPTPSLTSSTAEVHGNQVGLLMRSRCFRFSATMSCSTCHDVHQIQREAANFSGHCLTCHRADNCGEFRKLGAKISKDCIDCHMPVQPSSKIISLSNGKELEAKVRTHWIKIYPEKQPTE